MPSTSSQLNVKVRHWTTINRVLVADCRVFTVHKLISQRTTAGISETHDFYVFQPTDWVNVIAVTPDYQVVLIEQYRHGIEQVTLEIPGGMIDEEDGGSLIAGRRELLEETGCCGDNLVFLGRTLTVKQIQVPSFDGTEEVAIRLIPIKEIPRLIKNGMITHALVIVAFHYLQQYCLENAALPGIDQLNPFS